MLTSDGPRVIEFNVRFGDPEAEAILPLVGGRFTDLLMGAAHGTLDAAATTREPGAAVVVAIADAGYPEQITAGGSIEGLEALEQRGGVTVFGAGLERGESGWRLRGGRAAFVMARGDTVAGARLEVYRAIDSLDGRGWRCRRDVAGPASEAGVTRPDVVRGGMA